MVKKKKQKKNYEEMEEEEEPGCCPDTHAQVYEIALIICFILSFVLLTINIFITLWFFQSNYILLILEIIPAALNFISIILSVFLRCWRSDGTVFKKNFSSSNCVSCLLSVLIIINLILSIVEEVLFSFIQSKNHSPTVMSIVKIINKAEKKGYSVDPNDMQQKIIKYLPWVAFSFNNLIQAVMFILDCILMGRIQLKSHLGFPKRNKNKSAQSKMLNRSKKKSKRSSFFTTNPTDEINFKKKKKKKMKIFKKKKYY